MSPTKRRTRRERPARGTTVPAPGGTPAIQPARALPAWKWRTFPVYFAFSVALFIGVYLGWAAGYVQAEGNGAFAMVIFIVSALLMGFGLSRITTQFLISRNWIKPRPKKR